MTVSDGDKLDIDWDPTYSTPDSSIDEADDADDLSAHLKGIDTELGKKIYLLAVADIDDPSTELNAIDGLVVGANVLCYQVDNADNEQTLYVYDAGSTTAEDVPFTVDGATGIWIAVAGKYVSGAIYREEGFIGDYSGGNYAQFADDGLLTFLGTARVQKNEWINIGGLKAPGVSPAASVDWGISEGWEFTDGTDDTVVGVIRLPQDMDKTYAPQFKIGWASATADPGDDSKQVVWQVEYLFITPGESTVAAAQETLTGTTSASTTANGLTITTITGVDLPAASDQLLLIRIKRLGADVDDDLGDDCTLLGFGLYYVADKLGVAL